MKKDIRRLVQVFSKLNPLGVDYTCRCPFHQTSKRSMIVSPELDYFECFECGQKGNSVDFITAIRKVKKNIAWRNGEPVGTVYVLLLEGGRYYVGFTKHFDQRMKKHFLRDGADWTRRYAPLKVVEIHHHVPFSFENELTETYFRLYVVTWFAVGIMQVY